jgi:hypothetical protein
MVKIMGKRIATKAIHVMWILFALTWIDIGSALGGPPEVATLIMMLSPPLVKRGVKKRKNIV